MLPPVLICLSVRLSVYPSILPSVLICLSFSIHPSILLSFFPTVLPSFCSSVLTSIHLPICLSVRLYICPFIHPFVCPSVLHSIRPWILLSSYPNLSVCLHSSVFSSFHPSFLLLGAYTSRPITILNSKGRLIAAVLKWFSVINTLAYFLIPAAALHQRLVCWT